MGKQKIYTIEILNIDTGTKVKHLLDNAQLNYNELLEILESYNPQIDFENLVVYYYTGSKWMILLQSALNFDDHEIQWQDKESNQIQLKVKYHCFYILDEEEQKRFNDDVKIMNEKISQVHDLYQDLKEKYKQEALDIHIFWGSPLFAADKLIRNKKPMQIVVDENKEEHQLLINQVKYAPYVNAVTTALESCDKKKVHLQLNLLNDKSFNQRSVFTVVYLMAHLEIEEINDGKTNKIFKKPPHKQKRREEGKAQKKEKPKKYVLKQETVPPELKKTESSPLVFETPIPPLQKKISVGVGNSLQFQMIIEEGQIAEAETQEKSPADQAREIQKMLEQSDQDQTASTMQSSQGKRERSRRKSQSNFFEKEKEKEKAKEEIQKNDDDNEDVYYQKDYKNRKKGYRYYFLGEEVNGKLSKISPKKLKSIIKSRISRKIQLLILQSSYPFHHLQELKDLANNIILINSNLLFPEPSSIYFIKQFFIHLVQTGNIQQTYERSIKDLNKLKQFSLSVKHTGMLKEFDQKQIKFINNINEKYVHGNLQACCCYHKHHDRCHNRRNTSPSKFAQYHYKYHASQCQCIQENLMIHNCDGRKLIMAEHYDVIDKDNYHDSEFYYCCCLGYDLGFYERPIKNNYLEQLTSMNEEKDPHSIKYKYKYEKRMANEEDNQLEISEGKITGDWSKEVIQAFKYIEENPLLGNAPLIIRLFEIFTQELEQCSLDIIRRLNQNEIYMLCNIYGEKSTGRKTIATYFAKLLIIKKMYKRIIIKVFNNASSLRRIVQNSLSQSDGRPFFIFIHQDKTNKSQKNQLHLKEHDLGIPISAIIISDLPILLDKNLTMQKIKPIPFSTDNCQHYIKKYKHLSHQAKNNVSTIFHYGTKGYQGNSKFQIYPFSLNQFQILNLIRKTTFCQFKNFTSGLDRLSKDYIEYYIFLVYMIKFTNSPNYLKYINVIEIQDKLNAIESSKSLFFKHFDETLREGEDPELIKKYSSEVVNLNQIKDNFYLIFTSTGYKIKKKLTRIMQMFINHTTIIPNNKFNEDPRIKRRVNYLRTKFAPFSKQVYEATTINPASYINRYFDKEIQSIYKTFAQNRVEETQEMYDFQTFLKFHADLFTTRRGISKKLSYQTHSKPKERSKTQHYSSFDAFSKESSGSGNSQYESIDDQQSMDIPHVYHLASIIQGGLQFVRNVISNHFIYNRLNQDEKINMIKYSVLLINNCIILLKNKKFYDIMEQYDVEIASQENQELLYTQKFFHQTHSSGKLDSPYLKSRKSEEVQFPPPPSASRTYSGRDVFNQNRLFSTVNSNVANLEEDKQSVASDELLLKELHRLSTFKGLLFMLDQVQRRSQEILHEDIVRIKICAQLLAIQIRLQQLQVDKQETKIIISSSNPDRHLLRIAQIFNEKNHNISILYKILREEINLGRFNRDIQQLGLIKSHIIVSLSLMASRYGKYKIAKAKSMIREIDSFLVEWSDIPFQRRESQQHENHNNKQEFLNVKQLASEYGFLRMICQNQYVYIHILESFTSQKFWLREIRKNNEIETYQELLRIYHHFTLKNTKTKADYYAKLEKIIGKLIYFRKKKESLSFSTYIHNFVEYFVKLLESQFKKLKSNLISIFNADDDRDYVKTSLQQQLQTILKKKNNTKEFFNIKKKFNLATLNELSTNCGCKYLCIFTSIGQNNSKEEILIQSSDGKSGIINKDKVTDAISAISSSVIFVCLPRKKMLAESIIKTNRFKRSIIYFDFEIDNFQLLKNNADSTLLNNNVVIFEKMIMIETVKELIQGIIQKQNQGFKTGIYMAFNQCKNYLSFVLKSKDGRPLLRLSNKQFRSCLCIEQQDNFCEVSLPPKEIQFFQTQKVNKQQIESLEKIIKKMSIRKDKNNADKSEQFKIDEFYNVYHFIEIFSFYFRDKYGFDHIFNINFQIWKQDIKSNAIIKKFLEKLTDQKILDFIFSNNKGVIIMYFQHECYDLYSAALKNCESQLKNIISNIDQSDGKRTISKFVGYTNINRKKVSHIFIYILQGEDRSTCEKIS